MRLFAEEWGEGKPVVLLHGVGASTYSWRKVAPTLATTHRVIAIDLKGFGRSGKPEGSKYAARDQARLVARFLAARGLQKVTLVGHSFGGTVALALLIGNRAAAHRIQRLVLIDSPAYPQVWPLAAELLASQASDELLRAIPPEVIVQIALAQAIKPTAALTARDIAAYARPLRETGGLHGLAETVRDPGRYRLCNSIPPLFQNYAAGTRHLVPLRSHSAAENWAVARWHAAKRASQNRRQLCARPTGRNTQEFGPLDTRFRTLTATRRRERASTTSLTE